MTTVGNGVKVHKTTISTSTEFCTVRMTPEFIDDISAIRRRPVTPDDPELRKLIKQCIEQEFLAEEVTKEVFVMRFGSRNELSVYFTSDRVSRGQWPSFPAYCFVSAICGNTSEKNSARLRLYGKVVLSVLKYGFVAERGLAMLARLRDIFKID